MAGLDVRHLCRTLWELERRFDLLDLRAGDVKIWQAARMAVYYELAQATGVLEPPQRAPQDKGTLRKVEQVLKMARAAVRRSPLTGPADLDAIIIESPRVRAVGDEVIDIYTRGLARRFAEEGRRFLLLDPSTEGGHPKTDDPHRRFLDGLELAERALTRIYRPSLGTDGRRRIREVEASVRKRLSVSVDLVSLLEGAFTRFRVRYRCFKPLLRRLRPRELYLVCSYGKMAPIIRAAKELGIAVKELQHGTLSEYHLGYSFPDLETRGTLDYFPDMFLAWSDYWKRKIDWPLPEDRVIDFGFWYLEAQRHRYRHIDKHPGQIVVLSQGAVGRRLADAILERLPRFGDARIVYKLHPGEYDRWETYDSLRALAARDNVEVVTDADLYALFAASEHQIGVFSTALYEGMAFGLNTVLVDLPGIEYMADLLDQGIATRLEEFTP